jgi:hypothetical protein
MYFSPPSKTTKMVPKIKHTTREIYFKGDFLDTTLFCDGTFIISYNGVAMASENVGRLPSDVHADQVAWMRMLDRTAPPGINCGPIALFCLTDSRLMAYEFWTDPKMCRITGANGFWKTTSLVVGRPLTHVTPLKVIECEIVEMVDAEKSSSDVKFTTSYLQVKNSSSELLYYELK